MIGLLVATVARAEGESDLQRLAALVDYVAADYAGAVQAGRVVAPAEYAEQQALLDNAVTLARRLGPAFAAAVATVVERFGRRAADGEVVLACRAVRALLVEQGLVLVPQSAPSRARARQLYAANCARCHGESGRADTAEATKLDPRPVSFHDASRIARISPQLAYHALTFGVKGTAMAAFDTLPAADRWSLACHVIALRHDGVPGGEAIFRAAKVPLSPTASRLSGLTDQEIESLLEPALPAPAARAAAIAWLRTGASFTEAGGSFALARRLLAEIPSAAPARRHDLVTTAYLDGVEPHEAGLKARDLELARRIEAGFMELRRAVDAGEGEAGLAQRSGSIALLLDRAAERPAGATVAFVAALTIALREGLEAALLVAALLAFLRKSGRLAAARFVHLGWLAAIPFGVATWWIAGALVAGARRELVEAVVTLLAAAMILLVSHWILGQREAKHWLGFLQRKVMAQAPGDSGWPLFALAFIAAGREAFEVVLFYRALLLDTDEKRAIALGAGVGALSILGLVLGLQRLGRRLNPRPVMLASSGLLAALSVALVGRGVRALQEGGFVALSPLALPDLSVIGIYPSRQGLLAQAVTVALIFVPWLWPRLRRARAGSGSPGTKPAPPAG